MDPCEMCKLLIVSRTLGYLIGVVKFVILKRPIMELHLCEECGQPVSSEQIKCLWCGATNLNYKSADKIVGKIIWFMVWTIGLTALAIRVWEWFNPYTSWLAERIYQWFN